MLTRRRLLLVTINTLVVLALLTNSLFGPLPLGVASAHALPASGAGGAAMSPASSPNAQAFAQAALWRATTPSCTVYPIALHTSTLAGVPLGGTLGDIYNGGTPGTFGWLSWTGDPSEGALVTSLTPPGNSDTYVNPNDADDHTLASDKWVSGKSGVSNSEAVRDALTALETMGITVPVWDEAQGHGANSQYHVVGFAQIRLTAFQLPGANRITATYLGNIPCGEGEPPPPPPGPPLTGDTLTLTPSVAGPNAVGTTQTMTATLKTRAGAPVPDIAIHFTITGANAQTTLATTVSTGVATITYQGAATGTDQIQASADSGGTQLTSNTASVSWVAPVQSISTSTILARVFPADGSAIFNATPNQTPAFTQSFPTIDFNPPAGTIPGNTSGVTVNSRPMVDVTTDLNGNYTGTIILQGNGLQAGVGPLFAFNVVFTASFTVAAAGDITFNLFTDDGFILGVGNGATRVSGPLLGGPASGMTAFEGFPVMGAFNRSTPPIGNIVTVHFPGPGTYPYELDYSEGTAGQLVATMSVTSSGSTIGVPPTGALTLSPNTTQTNTVGNQQTFTVTATDAAGNPVANLGVALWISFANQHQETAVTDSNGHATLSYTGLFAGDDGVQAVAWIDNMVTFSAQVTVHWQASSSPPPPPPPPPPPAPLPLAIPGWIGSPTSQSTQMGSVPIKLASGITLSSGTIDYWPADNPDAATVLASNVSGSGGATLATLDTTALANGSYIIRLQGTSSTGAQLQSGVLITVAGENKPGRVTFSVTDLTVPVTGLPITIGHTYDSLLRDQSGDFGHGWNLTLGTPQLAVDQAHNVTLTLADGRRVTFYFTPASGGGVFGFLSTPGYTPEPGVYGSLTEEGCDLLAVSGGQYFCFPGTPYQPTRYTYTDPYGRAYVFDAASGKLLSLTDLDNNTLTFTPEGITSSAGHVHVAFTRDSAGRITQITDPAGKVYRYSYDADGNLASVTLPGVDTPISYTYDSSHLLLTERDPRGTTGVTTTYYPDGRLKTVTDALQETTSYSYDLNTHTTAVTAPDGGTTTYQYDSFGMLLKETDPLGHTTTYTYDDNHNLLSVTDPLGHKTSYTYDNQGNRKTATDPLNHTISATYNLFSGPTTLKDAQGTVWSITYDAVFHPLSVTDALGTVGGYTWNEHGQPLTRTDGNGQTTTYTYDQFGNLTSETDALGNKTSYTYDELGRKTSSTDARGHITTYTYNALGHLLTTTDPLGQTTTYTYDANGNQLTMTDALGRVTRYTYDVLNRLIKTTYPDDTTTSTTYDFRGNPLTQTDQAGNVTTYTYDLAGQQGSMTTADGTSDAATTLFAYDAAGRQVQVTDPLGHATTSTYDNAGHLLTSTDPLGHVTTFAYNNNGQQTSVTDANGHTTSFTYDIRGRLTLTTYDDGTTTRQSYDGQGNLLSSTDQNGKVTSYSYDAIGQLLSVTNPLHQATSYTYDPNGNLLTITDANGHTTSFTYDVANQQTRKTWPDGSFETFGYDAVGNQTSHRLTDGHTNTATYDVMNRLSQLTSFDGTSVSSTYTPTGQRKTVTDSRGTTTYTYDHQDRLIQITTPDGQSVIYAYDAAGNRVGLGTPAGSLSYSYDDANRLSSVSSQSVGTFQYSYDAVGNRIGLTLPNGITESFGYDALNRLTSLQQTLGSQTLASYTYTLDPAGKRTSVTNADGSSVSWTYDDASRLTGETGKDPGGATTFQASYSYDAAGNRTSATFDGQTTTYTYNSLDQLTSAGTTQYTYDGRGNLTQITVGASVTRYTYDAADRLISATAPNGQSADYAYDADGRRVQQTRGSSVTNYLWDEASTYGDVVLETDGSGATLASYILGDDELLAQTRGGTTSYYLDDGQGNVRLLTNSSGAITDSYAYDAFGTLQSSTGSTVNPYLYTGQQFDSLTGLYSLRARYYDPASGRFLSRDTAAIAFSNPVELNRYSYAQENPVNLLDPSGHGDTAEEGGLYTLILGVIRTVGAGVERAIPGLTAREIAILLAGLGALGLSLLLRWLVTHTPAVPVAGAPPATPTPQSCAGPSQAQRTGKGPTGTIQALVRGPEIDPDFGCHVNVEVSGRGLSGTNALNVHITYSAGQFYQNLVPTGIRDANDMAASVASDATSVFIAATRGEDYNTIYMWFYEKAEPRLQALMAMS